MKWILCGKNDVAIQALQLLVGNGDEVWAVGIAGDVGRDGWQGSFRAAAERAGVRFDQPRRINDPAFGKRLEAYGATALFSIQYDQILHGALLRAIGCPALNLHFSLLPRHRGVAPIAWAILSGDAEAGVTLHHMVEEIDAGDMIVQRSVPIHPHDTARDLYDRVAAAAAALFEASYPFPESLLRTCRKQSQEESSYHPSGALDFSRRTVTWNRPGADLHRWLRTIMFPPLQLPETHLAGSCYRIERVAGALGGPTSAPPGSVVSRSSEGIEVAAADRLVRITRLADAAHPELAPEHVLRSIAVGQRFASVGERIA